MWGGGLWGLHRAISFKLCILLYRINELKEKAVSLQEDIRQLEMDIEENQGDLSEYNLILDYFIYFYNYNL